MTAAERTVEELKAENARLQRIVDALIERSESSDDQRTDFGIFQATVLLEDQVRSRTRALDLALRQLEEANLALRQSRAELQAIFDVVPNPLAVSLLEDGTFLGVSHSFAEFFGIEPEQMIGRRSGSSGLQLWPDDAGRTEFLAALEEGEGRVTDVPLTLTSAAGRTSHLAVSARVLEIEGRRLLLTEFHDVTVATRDALRLRSLAEHDPMTGLANRRLLMQRIAAAVEHVREHGGRVAVCYADLDGFKAINDQAGHFAGDAALVDISRRLLEVVRSKDTVGRVGGDEFALLLIDVTDAAECEAVLHRALEAVSRPLDVPGFVGTMSTSIGYTLFPDDDSSPEQLLINADRALLQAKTTGKDRVVRFGG
jgi:diguanylate cyclase (GGDEF)-like protein/PAS domain S-box-containing protein